MNENKHTPEPWSVDPDSTDYYASILDADGAGTILLGDYVDWWMTKANARRIVACVNRLAQFTTEQIEDFGYDLFAEDRPRLVEAQNEIHLLKKQHDELLAALERCRFALEPYDDIKPRDWKSDRLNLRDAHQVAVAAIAGVKGEQ